MDKISVIVPVYKVEDYLDKCIKSLLNQTYKNFNIILVDDGSTDNCPQMCDYYADKYDNIHVIHQENGGLSAARNSGIEWVLKNDDSEWITFLDSDDWLHSQFLELALSCAKKFNSNIVSVKFSYTDSRDNKEVKITDPDFDLCDTFSYFTNEDYDPNSSCGNLYSKELWNDLRFPVGKLHEDRYTTYKILFQQERVPVVNHQLYYYYMNPEGIVHTDWSYRKLDDLEATEQQLKFFSEINHADAWKYTTKEYIHLLIFNMKQLKAFYTDDKKTYNALRNKLRRQLKQNSKKIGYSFKKNINIYKYAWPLPSKIYRRLHG